MYQYKCLNPIAKIGLNNFSDQFEAVDNVDDAHGILVRSAQMLEMEFSDKLLCIARAGAGVNNIPLEKCAEKGIVVFNTPGANANGVKEMVIAAMLLASRDIIGGVEWVKSNAGDPEIAKLTEKAKKKFAGTEIMGKKLGIIGLGAIGVRVANAAKNLGMDVYGYDPYLSVDAAWSLSSDVKHVTNVDDIYSKCDIITVHVPALDATKGMINAAAIAKMKKGVILRHLVLPGYLNNTRQVLDWIAETFAPGDVAMSLMSQYTPPAGMTGRLARRVTAAEYRAAVTYMRNCGIEDGFVQERTSAEEAYTPAFDGTGV